MTDKINIITSGCSFTETPNGSVIDNKVDDIFLEAIYDCHSHINYLYFFVQELQMYHKNNYTLYNLGHQSSGNHIIKTRLQNFIENNFIKGKIYSTTQLSSILRPLHCQSNFIDINHQKDEWIFDYDDSVFKNYEDVIKKQIDVYTQIHKIYDNHNINNKTFFGWGVLSPNDLSDNSVKKNFNNLEIDTYITNTHGEYCTHTSENTKYAGMTEFLLEQNLPISIYKSAEDAHLNPYANFIFYKEWYRKYFVDWGILPQEYEHDIDLQKLMEISNWQK